MAAAPKRRNVRSRKAIATWMNNAKMDSFVERTIVPKLDSVGMREMIVVLIRGKYF